MKNAPLLSIIVPVYNVAPYLRTCLDSIINQTYSEIEIICVDDGSTDDSLSILLEYSAIDPRIIVVHKANGGLVSARKTGICLATGEYATYVDSDDWIDLNMYQEMISQGIGADVIASGLIREHPGIALVENNSFPSGLYTLDKLTDMKGNLVDIDNVFKQNILIHQFTKITKTDLLRKWQLNVDNRINAGEDAAVIYPLLLDAQSVFISNGAWYHYRIRSGSISDKKNKDEQARIDILNNYLCNVFKQYQQSVSNVMEQYYVISRYTIMIQCPESSVYYCDGLVLPFGMIDNSQPVVIFGKGRFAKIVLDRMEKLGFEVIDNVDSKDYSLFTETYVGDIRCVQFIIGVLINSYVEEIESILLESGISEERIFRVQKQYI